MPFYFRLRYKFDHVVRNKGEAARIVEEIRLQSKLGEYYDGETIELLEEPKGWIGSAISMLRGK